MTKSLQNQAKQRVDFLRKQNQNLDKILGHPKLISTGN